MAECGVLEKRIIGLLVLGAFLIIGILYVEYMASEAVEKGLKYCIIGKYDKAITEFDKAIKLDPILARAYNGRSLTYSFENNFDQAIIDYTKGIRLNPGYAQGEVNRAVAYYFRHEYDKAWEGVYRAESLGLKVDPGFLTILKKASARQK